MSRNLKSNEQHFLPAASSNGSGLPAISRSKRIETPRFPLSGHPPVSSKSSFYNSQLPSITRPSDGSSALHAPAPASARSSYSQSNQHCTNDGHGQGSLPPVQNQPPLYNHHTWPARQSVGQYKLPPGSVAASGESSRHCFPSSQRHKQFTSQRSQSVTCPSPATSVLTELLPVGGKSQGIQGIRESKPAFSTATLGMTASQLTTGQAPNPATNHQPELLSTSLGHHSVLPPIAPQNTGNSNQFTSVPPSVEGIPLHHLALSDQAQPNISISQLLAMFPASDTVSTMDSSITASTALPPHLGAANVLGGGSTTTGLSGVASPSSAQLHHLIRAYGLLSPSAFPRVACKRGHSISPLSDLFADPLIRSSPLNVVALEELVPVSQPGHCVAHISMPYTAAGQVNHAGIPEPAQHLAELASHSVYAQQHDHPSTQDAGRLPACGPMKSQQTACDHPTTDSYQDTAAQQTTSQYHTTHVSESLPHTTSSGYSQQPMVMNNISVNVQTTLHSDMQSQQQPMYSLHHHHQAPSHPVHTSSGMSHTYNYPVHVGQACTVPGCTGCAHPSMMAHPGAMASGPVEEIVEVQVCHWSNCQMQFPDQEELVQHIEKLHIDQRHSDDFICMWNGCSRQQKPFNARYKLLIHMRVHSGEKPNKCMVSS